MKAGQKAKLAIDFLRFGLAFSFIYVAIAAYFVPDNWIGFIPSWAKSILPAELLLKGHIAFDAIIGLWLVSNKKIFYASILACLNLAVIVLVNIASLDIIFRDVSLLAAAIALAILTFKNN